MNEREKDIIRLQHIAQAIESIYQFVGDKDFQAFQNDLLTQSAVLRQFEIIGEASRNISDSIKDQNPDIPWEQVAGLRNLLIHEYFRVDMAAIWETQKNDLPPFKNRVNQLLHQLQNE